ncbi:MULTISPECIES: hypothetical protein [unclassified Variovorax]|uniref:hypothetical protein n=1 Tax=Variovorax atrisoli TaxID=3394203 RepID=UPI000F7DD0F3|nr:hypothetical protein [Variovorax sp. 369]RTD85907.1 hypothetical protein EJO68_28790 [Variovorax sp. 369]
MTIKEICRLHGLDLERGSRVLCDGRLGTVAGANGRFLRVKFDGNQISSPCDPLDVQPVEPTTISSPIGPDRGPAVLA